MASVGAGDSGEIIVDLCFDQVLRSILMDCGLVDDVEQDLGSPLRDLRRGGGGGGGGSAAGGASAAYSDAMETEVTEPAQDSPRFSDRSMSSRASPRLVADGVAGGSALTDSLVDAALRTRRSSPATSVDSVESVLQTNADAPRSGPGSLEGEGESGAAGSRSAGTTESYVSDIEAALMADVDLVERFLDAHGYISNPRQHESGLQDPHRVTLNGGLLLSRRDTNTEESVHESMISAIEDSVGSTPYPRFEESFVESSYVERISMPPGAGAEDSVEQSFNGSDESITMLLHRLAADDMSFIRNWLLSNDEGLVETQRRVLQMGLAMAGSRLSAEEVQALPKIRFNRPEHQQCSICLEAFKAGELLTEMPRCSHFFHVECVATWFQNSTVCPLCRSHCEQSPRTS